ncbi:MAG: hypothetical protein ACTHMG_05480 [Sphingomonas sp.]
MPVRAWKIAVPAVLLVAAGGCAQKGQITAGGITAIRTPCPTVAVPAGTGDITLFNPATSQDQSALDVTAVMTNVRSTCDSASEKVVTNISFQVDASRTHADAARDVTLPYFIAVVQGGTVVSAKRTGQVTVHFDAGQARASTSGTAVANVDRAAATLPQNVRDLLTKPRKAGSQDAAVDPLSEPKVREAVQRATFQALVGFQLTDAQLKYNMTR